MNPGECPAGGSHQWISELHGARREFVRCSLCFVLVEARTLLAFAEAADREVLISVSAAEMRVAGARLLELRERAAR